MSRWSVPWWILSISLLSACAWGANPIITLKVENRTGPEVLQALRRVSGADLRWSARDATQRESFDWKGVPLGQALREVATRFHAAPQLNEAEIQRGVLRLGGSQPAPDATRVGVWEHDGMKLSVTALQAKCDHSFGFTGAGAAGTAFLSLQVRLDTPGRDAGRIVGIENTAARDDRGNILHPSRYASGFGSGAVLPDEWMGGFSLGGYDSNARKLLWVEGTLLEYRRIQNYLVELPWPGSTGVSRKEVSGAIVQLRTTAATGPESGMINVQVTLSPPEAENAATPPAAIRGLTFELENVDGVVSGAGGSYSPRQVNAVFPAGGQTPLHVVVSWQDCRDSAPLATFRIRDVPLPIASPGARLDTPAPVQLSPRHGAPPMPLRAVLPFMDERGGGFESDVVLPEENYPFARVSLGLSRFEDRHWGPVRWQDVPLYTDGTFHREWLAPGRYRVLRRFQPAAPIPELLKGKWQNADVIVEITPGKTAHLSPLRWIAPGKPPSARRSPGPASRQK